jgi:hypothetical protein
VCGTALDPGAELRGLGTGMGIDRTALERAATLALTNRDGSAEPREWAFGGK